MAYVYFRLLLFVNCFFILLLLYSSILELEEGFRFFHNIFLLYFVHLLLSIKSLIIPWNGSGWIHKCWIESSLIIVLGINLYQQNVTSLANKLHQSLAIASNKNPRNNVGNEFSLFFLIDFT